MKVHHCIVILFAILVVVAYVIALPVFYGLFAFAWTEDWQCYASQDSDASVPWDMSLGDPPGDYHNVSDNFYMVNLWGLINFLTPFGIGCCAGCFAVLFRDSDLSAIIGGILLMLNALSYLAHFITMLVMRYRHAGRVCSGDYDSDLHFWRPFEDPESPFLHKTGTWFFYVVVTQLYLICMGISGISFYAGVEH